MSRSLSRLFRPDHIAIVGGGAWCASVADQCRKMGYLGNVWRVNPKGGDGVFTSVGDLPAPPDAVFIGINRFATIDVVEELSRMGAGGAVCFASGFSEAAAEDVEGTRLQERLLAAAGEMPILGPNCYGFINALDGALLWPDQHGCTPVASGVAILTQSSNIAINLTMQARGLPIAYTVACGNMAQTTQADIASDLLDDPRVTAIGLHVEGFGDLEAWQAVARKAHALGKAIIALKVGKSEQAQAATISHTASLAGGDAGADALLKRLGIARVHSLSTFLETLKLLHVTGPLASNCIGSISCSGGEASLAADTAHGLDLQFPPLTADQRAALAAGLGPMVALANPLDYHTYIWRDEQAMTAAWSGMADPGLALLMIILDYPRSDRCDPSDWEYATKAALNVRARTGMNVAVVATLPELLPEPISKRLMEGGVVPLLGLTEAMEATEAAAQIGVPSPMDICIPPVTVTPEHTLTEAQAKAALAQHGVDLPKSESGADPIEIAQRIGYPVVLKGEGIAHKTEAGAVALNISSNTDLSEAAARMPTDRFLVEEMVIGGVAELIVGVTKDPAHGFVLTLGAGGVLTEILKDTASLLLPSSRAELDHALRGLRIAPLLAGYRGQAAADRDAILDAILAVQSYVLENAATVSEVEINPLICTPTQAIAADALIRKA